MSKQVIWTDALYESLEKCIQNQIGLRQMEIILGVSRSTISRKVRQIEKEGKITLERTRKRTKNPSTGKEYAFSLPAGSKETWCVIKAMITGRPKWEEVKS